MASGDIQGTVTDASGNPISGLTIYLINEANPNVVTTTTTDANGDYQFDDHPDAQTASDTYHVVAGAYDDGTDLFNTFSKPQVAADLRAPFFDVSISGTNDPVTEGNDLNVDYAVSNTGGSGTQDITLEIDNTQEAVDSGVAIASGGSTTGTLTWNTVDGEAGSYTATVASADDSVSTSVTVETAIPDSGASHQWNFTEGSGTLVSDVNGSLNADYNSITWASGKGIGGVHADLSNDTQGFAVLTDSSGLEELRNGTGTFGAWVKTESSLSSWYALMGAGSGGSSGIRGGGTSNFGFGSLDGAISASLQLDSYRQRSQSSSPYDWTSSEVVGNWVFYAGRWDNGSGDVWIAVPSDNYSLTKVSSPGTVSNTTSSWDGDVALSNDDGVGDDAEEWPGQQDLSFFDRSAMTESTIQSFVDDSKVFYE